MFLVLKMLIDLGRLLFFLLLPGGMRRVTSEYLFMKHQLAVLSRKRIRSPNLTSADRLLFGLLSLSIKPRRLLRSCLIISPATILRFHKLHVNRKYRLLFSAKSKKKPGPKGPSPELIRLIVEMKEKNPIYGCERIAYLVSDFLNEPIDDQTVRRILRKYWTPKGGNGPSWLTFLGHTKDSLWSVDFFCTESILLQTYCVMIVMDQFTRRIIGFAIQKGPLNGECICSMFVKITGTTNVVPKRLSHDNDPLFRFLQWKRNMNVMGIEEIRSLPFIPTSHPFVERPILTFRNEFLDRILFWNTYDLEKKLIEFQNYFNQQRIHFAHKGKTPGTIAGEGKTPTINLENYRWQSYCRGLYSLPKAA